MKARGIPAAVVIVLALWYLRDPSWLDDHTTGLRPWERAGDGHLARWSGGHASFFVPSGARSVRVPIATSFDRRDPQGSLPMVVTFTIDDQRAARVLLADASWQDVTLELPPAASRHVRRVDVRTSITRDDNHGVMLGAPAATFNGTEWRLCCFSPR